MAVACLATSPFFWEMGRIAVTDMLMTALVVGALAWARSIQLAQPGAVLGQPGLNFLSKGPP